MSLLDNVKASVRIRDSVPPTPAEKQRSNDIQGLINACKDDIRRVGVDEGLITDSNVRVENACKLFVKAALDYQGKGSEYKERYESYISAMALDVDYKEA